MPLSIKNRSGRHHGVVRAAALSILLSLSIPAFGYIRSTTSTGSVLRRTDAARIEFLQNEAFRPGMRNSAGNLVFAADSDPGAALRAALNAWSAVPVSTARFAPLETTPAANNPRDGKHVFVMSDTPEIRSLLQGALAVTSLQFFTDGRIIDTDIVFNPDIATSSRRYLFSTTLASGTYDLQSVATHELGHALGAGHSAVVGSVMFPITLSQSPVQSRPREDDISFLAETYPAAGASAFGTLSGMVRFPDGTPVRGALVAALDPSTGAVVGGMTNLTNGAYRIARIPPGRYIVLVEPADDPFLPMDVGISDSGVHTDFGTAVLGGAASPELVEIPASGSGVADLTVASSKTLNAIAIGIGSAGGSGEGRGGRAGIVARAGQPADVLMWVRGANASEVSVQVLGPGLSLRPGSVRSDPLFTLSGIPALRFTIDVDQAPGLGTVLISQGDSVAAYAGGLVLPGPSPVFTARGVANAAGYAGPGVAAGEIVSIYGVNLGPAGGVQNGGLEPSTGALPSDLGNVSVLFDNQFAPLFYVSSGQINIQAPYEIAGRSTTSIVVRALDAVSSPILVTVAAAVPGIFAIPGRTQGIVFNEDGSLNGPSSPAARGSVITIFGTGAGEVNPPVGSGLPTPVSPLSHAQNPTVTIGGVAAPVHFGGLTPNFAGLYQLNATVPAGARPGDAVTLQIGARGVSSPPGVTIAVR